MMIIVVNFDQRNNGFGRKNKNSTILMVKDKNNDYFYEVIKTFE